MSAVIAAGAQAAPPAPQMALGDEHTVLIKTDGSLWAWGNGPVGQLGLGETGKYRTMASRVGTDTDWESLAAGTDYNLALKSDGSLWAWGNGAYGRLGLGDEVTRWVPTRVGAATDWTAIATGLRHSFGIKTDGSLWAWGLNNYGQLGLGTTVNQFSPVKVGDGFAAIDGGGQFSAAIKTDGTLWTWGRNHFSQLGLGDADTADHHSPVQVGSDAGWTAVSCSDEAARALRNDQTLWAWGRNSYGQLGLGDEVTRSTPTQLSGLWASVRSADDSTYALKADGSLWAWGDNTYGQLGQNFADPLVAHPDPLRVGTASDWSAVFPGHDHVGALRGNDLWMWGKNGSAQLGLVDKIDRLVPTYAFDASDVTAPSITSVSSTSHPNIDLWYTDPTPSFVWTASDDSGDPLRYSYLLDQSLYTIPVEITTGAVAAWTAPATADGTWYFHVRAADLAGNWGPMARVRVKIDATAPVTSDDAPSASKTAVTVHLSATDATPGSGVAGTQYKLDAGDWTSGTEVIVSGDGVHTLAYRSTDVAGNVETAKSRTIAINVVDTIKPVTTDDAPSGWSKVPVTVHLSASDVGSGVAKTQYKLDSATSWATGTQVVVDTTGLHTIAYRSTDFAGNVEAEKTCTVAVDLAAPVTTDDAAAWSKAQVTVHLIATDKGSGFAGTQYKLDDGAWTSGTVIDVSGEGLHTLVYRSTDVAGNVEKDKTVKVGIDASRPTTKAPRSARVRRGRTVALTYVVRDTGSPKATVTIKIKKLNGKTVKTLRLGKRAVNVTSRYKYRCKLPKGKYRFYVYATDLARNRQSVIGRNSLKVY